MVQGHHPDYPKKGDNSRSAWVFDFACNAIRAGIPDEITLGILLDSDYAISASVLEKGNAARYAERQVRNAHTEVALDADEFEQGDKGKVANSVKNMRLALHPPGRHLPVQRVQGRADHRRSARWNQTAG